MLKQVNADFISDKVKIEAPSNKKGSRTVQLEIVISEKPPPSKQAQMMKKVLRFSVELGRQSAIVVGVFAVFFALAAPLLGGSALFELGSRCLN